MKLVFWSSAGFVACTFAAYPLVMWMLAWLRRKPVNKAGYRPTVSIVIAVHNGAAFLGAKLKNLAGLAYPKQSVDIIIACDGCDDSTEEILAKASGVKVVICPRVGKAEALNRALELATGEIVVFTDVRQELEPESVRELVANFADELVGCVSGELMFRDSSGQRAGVSAYWKLEKAIRKWESESGSVVGATGAIYAVRRKLIPTIPRWTLLDDVYVPLAIMRQGKRVIFEPAARAWDEAAHSSHSEFKRKVRTLAGNFQLLQLCPWALLDARINLRFIGHKITRLMAPWALATAFISGLFLLASPLYLVITILQLALYATAALAGLIPAVGRFRPASAALAFCLMNVAAAFALFRFLRHRHELNRLWILDQRKYFPVPAATVPGNDFRPERLSARGHWTTKK